MFLQKSPSGIYYLWYKNNNGKKQKVSTRCKIKSGALKFLQHFNEEQHEKKMKLERITLSVLIKDYLTYSRSRHTPATHEGIKLVINEFLSFTGDMSVEKIDVRKIEIFIANGKERASAWTARRFYIILRSMFETAKRWNMVTENVCAKVEKPKVPEIIPVYFSIKEFQQLLSFIGDKNFRDLCLTAFYTGMRLGELLSLEWCNIDFTLNLIQVKNSDTFTTKSKKNRVIPMNTDLVKHLKERKLNEISENPLVFLNRFGRALDSKCVSKRFKNIVIASGLNKKLHFHSLRHTFCTLLVSSGVSLFQVQKLAGHSSPQTTMIYSHAEPQQMFAEVNKISLN